MPLHNRSNATDLRRSEGSIAASRYQRPGQLDTSTSPLMLLRLRSRDGLERIQVPDDATVAQLKSEIHRVLNIPTQDMALSKDAKLLTTKEPEVFTDLQVDSARLSSLGVAHGDMVYLLYHFERSVRPAYQKSEFEKRPFGPSMNVNEMIARQTRIERQEAANCASVSFERHAANAFQSYVRDALAFSIKRGGILYGRIDDEKNVIVECIYEPPQSATADSLQLERGTEEEQRADYIADLLGLAKVGWIFTQSAAERDYIMSSEEVQQMAAMQDELGSDAVTGVVSVAAPEDGEEGVSIHFEAFQVSDQAVRLWKDGWFQPQEALCGESKLRNPKDPKNETPVIVAVKDLGEVDNDYFLIPVGIRDHEGGLHASFPVENRLLPQDKAELRAHLKKFASQPYVEALADFHLLLWLSAQPHFDLGSEIAQLAGAVKEKTEVPEGYKLIIQALAES